MKKELLAPSISLLLYALLTCYVTDLTHAAGNFEGRNLVPRALSFSVLVQTGQESETTLGTTF